MSAVEGSSKLNSESYRRRFDKLNDRNNSNFNYAYLTKITAMRNKTSNILD